MRLRIPAISLVILICSSAAGQIEFSSGSGYRYLKGINASDLPADWMTSQYNDSEWSEGNAPFRYGDGTGGVVLTDMMNSYSTLYLRSSFNAFSIDRIKTISFRVNYDDGFVIWVNGTRVMARNAPATLSYNALATANHESGTFETFQLDSSDVQLVEGTNLLCIQAFNVSLNSSDFYFDMAVNASLSLPEVPETLPLNFDHEAGFCETPFDLVISSGQPGYDVIYTIDGSNPQTSSTATRSNTAVTLRIDPAISAGRPATPVFLVRASLVIDGYSPSRPVTKSFIFLDKVLTQGHPGGEWPSSPVNGQVIDLGMDPGVVNDPRYSQQMKASLTDIPSISLVTDLADMFGASRGIYVNAYQHGEEWERQCSLELINPDNTIGFRVNAGVRIRGGASRSPDNPKHAFRLFFRKEYGPGKLLYPLFGDEGAAEFDKVDLRTEQNYSWSKEGDTHNTFLRDIFSRDTQRDMGQPYTRGRYYHLYLNGMYWGLFQTEERPDADYAETYFGDGDDDYDVIKVSVETWPYLNEATDGTMESWQELYNRCNRGFASNSDYFALEGKDQNGNPVKNTRVWVDIDNLIDYMLVIFYTGNFDAPVSAFYGNAMANNYFAILNRKNKGEGFIFIAHDSEHSMFVRPYSLSSGINENRVSISNPAMTVSGISNFQPQWLHHKLTSNAEYRLRFADRAYKRFTAGGVLSPGKCINRFNARKAEVEMAIIAESARWGDAKTPQPRNKIDHWLPEVNDIVNNFFPDRSDIVMSQLRSANLYPSLEPVVVKESGLTIWEKKIVYTSLTITLENPNNRGQIYYTTDGSDPRQPGGTVSSKAVQAQNGSSLGVSGSMIFRSRILDGQTWSALREVRFSAFMEDYSNLKVTELHYHPADLIRDRDTIDGKDLEFIELKNTGKGAMNISGITLDTAVYYRVPDGTMLPPKGFWVVASKPEEFYSYYGMKPSGNYSGHFSNAGEYLLITDKSGNKILGFTFSDDFPWPVEADGDGYSLVSSAADPSGNPGDATYWKRSMNKGGSPFADDPVSTAIERFINGRRGELRIWPNPTSGMLVIDIDEEISGPMKLLFTSVTGATALVRDVEGTTLIDLSEHGLAPGVYTVTAWHAGVSYMTKLIYIPER
ncbi:MAG TPA: hypothetical protein GXX76_11085 [Bacteroidales bacterium]|nr:hypothetical protein [Bacteroidales bacterium]